MENGAPAQAARPNQSALIRPEQVGKLPHLTPDQKRNTEAKVKQFWDYINANPGASGDPNYQRAHQQLAQLSSTLMQGMKQYNIQRQRQQAQANGTLPSSQLVPNQNQNLQQQQQQPSSQQLLQQQQQQQQNQAVANVQQQQQQQMSQPAQPQPQSQQQAPTQQATGSVTFSQLLPEVQARVNTQTFYYPPAMTENTRPADQWLQEAKARYGQAIQRAQMARSKKAELQRAAQSRQQSGNPLSQEEQNGLSAKLAQCEKAIRESQSFMEKFKEQQDQFRAARPQQRFSQTNGPAGQVISGENGSGEGVGPQMQQNMQGPQAHSIATAQAAARASAGAGTNATNIAGGSLQGSSQTASTPVTSASQQTPIDQAAAQAGFNVQNTMMSQAATSRPSTAVGPGPQSVVHPSAAPNPNGQQTPHAHPNSAVNAHPLNAVNGMKSHPPPISKNLQVSEPTPVAMPPARPTLNGGANVGMPGQLAQPALTTFPGYVLEQSEDGHLLSKKKLQDLVREVIGPNADDQLTPEAEEICLNLVDDFVEDLITSGCRLAKLRGATTLEARDCMVVLERQYNLRVPGFSTDEARVVKKTGPAQGWAHKVSAVQAAKLMNGAGGPNGIGAGAANGGS